MFEALGNFFGAIATALLEKIKRKSNVDHAVQLFIRLRGGKCNLNTLNSIQIT